MVRGTVTLRTVVLQSFWFLNRWQHPLNTAQAESPHSKETPTLTVESLSRFTTGFYHGNLTDHDLTATSYSASTSYDPCRDEKDVRLVGSGVIELREDWDVIKKCSKTHSWELHTKFSSDGIVLLFKDVRMRDGCILKIFSQSSQVKRSEWRRFAHEWTYTMSFSPLLLREQRVTVELDTSSRSSRSGLHGSVVRISYFTHPANKMPTVKLWSEYFNGFYSTSFALFHCSGDVIIPEVLRCNMVQDCVLNEDERDCEYTKQGCEPGWVPHKGHCFKIEFYHYYVKVEGMLNPTFPKEAEQRCTVHFQASLATHLDEEGVALLSRIVKQSGHRDAVVGIKKFTPLKSSSRLRHMYRFLWQWGNQGSPMAYTHLQIQKDGISMDCAVLSIYPRVHFQPLQCAFSAFRPHGYICMKPHPTMPPVEVGPPVQIRFSPPSSPLDRIATKQCADGSLVQTFHRCSSQGQRRFSKFASFHCRYGPPVHYTLVCDGNNDCVDGSDEQNCETAPGYPLQKSVFLCDNLQMIDRSQRCDGMADCFDDSDELDCAQCSSTLTMALCTSVGCVPKPYSEYFRDCSYHGTIMLTGSLEYKPFLVTFDGYGMSRMTSFNESHSSGEAFRCLDGFFIPSFLLNNGEKDCLHGEDEGIPPENITCPGFYICQYSGQCLHPKFICDGINHCPYKDDERYCDLQCPVQCLCEGFAYKCTGLGKSGLWHARYLDLSGSSNVSSQSFNELTLLKFLNLSCCKLRAVSLRIMLQVRILDLSFNQFNNLSSLTFEGLTDLRTLNLSGNPFLRVLDSSFEDFIRSSGLACLNHLIITDTELQSIENRALNALDKLTTLDIQRNKILLYDQGIFSGLSDLNVLRTDDSKLCCTYFQTDLTECIAPVDELSSCDDLLRLTFFRVFLWFLSSLAIVGNAGVLIIRVCSKQHTSSASFRVLVCNLCTADFVMGVYLMIIGIADASFQGMYVAKERQWKSSFTCKMAGFLSLVSSEMSALTICLITLDRLLVLAFPFNNEIHFKKSSSLAGCFIVWLLGLSIAAAPFVLDLEFYGETDICLPLPITRKEFSGQFYAFAVFIVLNLVLFTIIGMGQTFIYFTIRRAGKMAGSQRQDQDAAIARRLFLVVFTDFCCWFPIGLMGMLAFRDVPIPGEVNVWAAIFILPVNAALNPFLYTLNTVLEKRRTARLQHKAKRILRTMQTELPRMEPSMAREVVQVCIQSEVVKKEMILCWLKLRPENYNTSYKESVARSERT